MTIERTLSIIKPDAVAKNVIGQIYARFEAAGLKVIAPPQHDLIVDYPFASQKDLNRIFEQMTENEVKDWTWERFAKNHVNVWGIL